MTKVKSKDYQKLIDRLHEEIRKNHESVDKFNRENTEESMRMKEISEGYIAYHQEIIGFIQKIDNED